MSREINIEGRLNKGTLPKMLVQLLLRGIVLLVHAEREIIALGSYPKERLQEVL